jgi:hypothetical protein
MACSPPPSSARATTRPGRRASARSSAIPAGATGRSSPSTSTACPRSSSQCPATGSRRARAGISVSSRRTMAPRRERWGCTVGTSTASSGAAVTGPDAERQHRPAQRPQQAVEHLPLPGPGQQARCGGRAGEGHDVDLTGDDGVQQAVDGRDVDRRHPPVHRHLDDLGARHVQRLDDVRQRLAVQLHRDAGSSTPRASRCSSTSADDSDGGDHASTSPVPRIALAPSGRARSARRNPTRAGAPRPAPSRRRPRPSRGTRCRWWRP